jgi:hypothetical protein
MSTQAAHFIVKLATDPVLLGRYQDNPMEVLNESGLSAEDVDILSRRDAEVLRKYLGARPPRLGNGVPPKPKPGKKRPSKKKSPSKKKPGGKKV